MKDMVPEARNRGGECYGRFRDSFNSEIVVKPSSACQDAVWVFTHPDPRVVFPGATMEPHLNRDQARELVAALQKFIEGGR